MPCSARCRPPRLRHRRARRAPTDGAGSGSRCPRCCSAQACSSSTRFRRARSSSRDSPPLGRRCSRPREGSSRAAAAGGSGRQSLQACGSWPGSQTTSCSRRPGLHWLPSLASRPPPPSRSSRRPGRSAWVSSASPLSTSSSSGRRRACGRLRTPSSMSRAPSPPELPCQASSNRRSGTPSWAGSICSLPPCSASWLPDGRSSARPSSPASRPESGGCSSTSPRRLQRRCLFSPG